MRTTFLKISGRACLLSVLIFSLGLGVAWAGPKDAKAKPKPPEKVERKKKKAWSEADVAKPADKPVVEAVGTNPAVHEVVCDDAVLSSMNHETSVKLKLVNPLRVTPSLLMFNSNCSVKLTDTLTQPVIIDPRNSFWSGPVSVNVQQRNKKIKDGEDDVTFDIDYGFEVKKDKIIWFVNCNVKGSATQPQNMKQWRELVEEGGFFETDVNKAPECKDPIHVKAPKTTPGGDSALSLEDAKTNDGSRKPHVDKGDAPKHAPGNGHPSGRNVLDKES